MIKLIDSYITSHPPEKGRCSYGWVDRDIGLIIDDLYPLECGVWDIAIGDDLYHQSYPYLIKSSNHHVKGILL